jgi:SAM-dependent methyltransferase
VALARRFARVVATDLSRRQLAHAPRVAGIDYAACLAETSPLRQGCADAVIVSAALHWFDRPRFYAEVRRVARPGALLAVWSYYHSRVSPEVDPVLDRFADHDIAPWWGPGMAMNRTRYRDLDLPFERLPWPAFEAEARMTLEELLDYVRTWSATQACARATGTDPVETIRPELGAAWGDPGVARTVRWPLHGGIARLPD